ncbi:phage holin family protein [Agathobaculum sp.]|uniref:phage holin family protein n=1 Tax=Agathobaculum sp. TaxID=2048138 RepID=UPI002A839172|nr:phage holin family protein [Agathobaculum sp.]MDY3619322.1 phage holin family protein [Agathobaculum sp.]
MESIMNVKNLVLAGLAMVGGTLAKLFGGWDAALQVLVGLMAADYITGVLVALFWQRSNKSDTGALDSKAGFRGICKKGMILLLVWLGVMLENATGAGVFRTMIVLFFIGNEGLSLLENIGLMGVPYPEFLRKALESMKQKGDEGGDGNGNG